jgi:hypothetical protein
MPQNRLTPRLRPVEQCGICQRYRRTDAQRTRRASPASRFWHGAVSSRMSSFSRCPSRRENNAHELPYPDGQFAYPRLRARDVSTIRCSGGFHVELSWLWRRITVRRSLQAGNKPLACGIFSTRCRILGTVACRTFQSPTDHEVIDQVDRGTALALTIHFGST